MPLGVHDKCRSARIHRCGIGHYVQVTESMAEASTRLLRESDDPLWARLRMLLAERGIDPSRCALGALFPDDTDMEFGVVVTPDRAVFEFDLHHGTGDLTHQAETAFVSDWRNITDWWESSSSRQYVEDALPLLLES